MHVGLLSFFSQWASRVGWNRTGTSEISIIL